MVESVTLVLSDSQAESLRREFVEEYESKVAELNGARAKKFQQKYKKITMPQMIGLLLANEYELTYDI